MKVNSFAQYIVLSAVALILVGCVTEPPFVSRPYTIDREAADFPDGPTLQDGSSVTVCYADNAGSPDDVRALAIEECGRFGLQTQFTEQHYETCPVTALVAAVFECIDPNAPRDDTGSRIVRSSTISIPAFSAPRGVLPPDAGINAEDVSTTAKSEPFPTFLLRPETAR